MTSTSYRPAVEFLFFMGQLANLNLLYLYNCARKTFGYKRLVSDLISVLCISCQTLVCMRHVVLVSRSAAAWYSEI